MHLLQSAISLDVIRDFLGHADAKTTEIYARANLEMKRKALEKIADKPRFPRSRPGSRTKRCRSGCARSGGGGGRVAS